MNTISVHVVGTRGFPGVQGGVEKHCEELYSNMISQYDVKLHVYARKPYFPRSVRVSSWNGISFQYLWCPRAMNLEAIVHTFLACLLCIVKRMDIVHFHNMGPAIFIPLLKLARKKTVLTYHSINYKHQKWGGIAKCVLHLGEFLGVTFADRIIAVSIANKEFLEKKYRRKDIVCIPNGVRISETMANGRCLAKYGLRSKKYVFTACRLTPEKGVHDLISAYLMLKDPAFKLVIAGSADHESRYAEELKEKVRNNPTVVMTGMVTGETLSGLYANAGLFVLPSYFEGLPISLLEAMSHGVPVLVSDISPMREIPLRQVRYFKVGDIQGLSSKIVELISMGIEQNERDEYRMLLSESYSWDGIAEKTYAIYTSLVG